ncbi:MAG: recombinase family protein, partial [Desulfobacteraceae bacterium]
AKRWNATTIRKILILPAYKGEHILNKYFHKQLKKDKLYMEPDRDSPKPEEDWITVQFPPLITEERWNLIQKRREHQKSKPTKPHKGHENYFLVNKALGKSFRCGECGASMQQNLKARKRKKSPKERLELYYLCNWKGSSQKVLDLTGRERCILKMVNSEYVDAVVYKSVVQLLSNPVAFGKQWLTEHDTSELKQRIEGLKKQIQKLDQKIDEGYDLITEVDDPTTRRKYKSNLKNNISERNRLQAKLDLKEDELKNKAGGMSRLKELQQDMKIYHKALSDVWKKVTHDKWESAFKDFLFDLPFEEKKRIIEAVIAPEEGGKVYIRYPRRTDGLDPDVLSELTPEDWERDRRTPLIDKKPVVDLMFNIDVVRLRAIVEGLNKNGIFEKIQSERNWLVQHQEKSPSAAC